MNTQTLWHEFLTVVREEVGSRVVETWFKAIKVVAWDMQNATVLLEAPNAFVRDWVMNHYRIMMEQQLARLLNEKTVRVQFTTVLATQENTDSMIVPARQTAEISESGTFEPAVRVAIPVPRSGPSLPKVPVRTRGILHPQFTFDTLIEGPHNKLAVAAAHAIVEKPGRMYNPFFMYGASGLGKTHLMHAIGHALTTNHRKISLVYQPADRFVHEFINAIRLHRVYHFEARFKDIDVLLVDDIQFISHKEQTQEAFFHIFNMLHQAHKQIVFTSDSLPRDIAGLAERMRSRLEGGLIADIQLPALETRVAILKAKAEKQGIELPDDVAHEIAVRCSSNIRELEGGLIRVAAYASLAQQPLSLEMVYKTLVQAQVHNNALRLATIAQIVAEHFNLTVRDLRSANRQQKIAHVRHVAMYCMKQYTTHSLSEIAEFLDRRDHTTVLYACEKIESDGARDASFAATLASLQTKLRDAQRSG